MRNVDFAAVVMVPGGGHFTSNSELQSSDFTSPGLARPRRSSFLPILGNDILQTWTKRVHKLGMQDLWITSTPREPRDVYSTLHGFPLQGVARFLVIKLNSYAEMDLADLIRFHCQTGSTVTEVNDSRGRLGICVFDQLPTCTAPTRRKTAVVPENPPRAYPFHGYAKRILSARERQELVGDALTGACAMRPSGTEIREQVWIGANVTLSDSVRLIGPSFIGDGTVIRAGATIGPFASVEHDCVVDSGTTVQRSTILPGTYMAPGLRIRRALVDGGSLEDLSSGAVADLQSGLLARRMNRFASQPQSCKGDSAGFFSDIGVRTCRHPSSSVEWHQVQL